MKVSWINLGGGLGIPYFPNEQRIELAVISDAVRKAIDRLRDRLGKVEVVMELGRYLVGEAGIYVTKVLDVKKSRGKKLVICDGGLHHHLAATGNFGQVIRRNYPIVAVTKTSQEQQVTIVGPSCTPLDVLGDGVTTSILEPGSLVAVLQSGAYGMTASPKDFLSHPKCQEILV